MAWNSAELFAALEEYRRALISHGLSESAVTTYVGQSGYFLRWRVGDHSPRGAARRASPISPVVRVEIADLEADLVEYQGYLRSAGLAPLTVSTSVDQARRFVAWLAGAYVPRGPRRGRAEPAARPARRAGVARKTAASRSRRNVVQARS